MRKMVTFGFVAAAVVLAPAALAQENKDKLDKKVIDIVKQTGDLYKNAKSMRVDATITSKVPSGDNEQEIAVAAVYEVEKPNKLAIKTKVGGDEKKGLQVIADGKNLIVLRKTLNQYTEQESPKGLADIGMGLLRLGPVNAGMLFANILADDPADLLMQGVNECSYAGTDKIDGTPVHKMKFSQDQFDWELYVASEGKPYILRMVSMFDGPNGKSTTTETYKNWKFDGEMPKDTFTFTAPKEATKVGGFDVPRR
jgi:hypothetical protein